MYGINQKTRFIVELEPSINNKYVFNIDVHLLSSKDKSQ